MSNNYMTTHNFGTRRLSKNSKIKTEIIYENFSAINYNVIEDIDKTASSSEGKQEQETLALPKESSRGNELHNIIQTPIILKLGAEKITLKSQQQQPQQQLINKSIATETEAITSSSSSSSSSSPSSLRSIKKPHQQQQQRRFSFNIAPRQTLAPTLNDCRKFPEIKLTSARRATDDNVEGGTTNKSTLKEYKKSKTTIGVPVPPPLPPPPPSQSSLTTIAPVAPTTTKVTSFKAAIKPPASNNSNNTQQITAEVYNNLHSSSDNSESNSQTEVITTGNTVGGGNASTSPESLLDHILSAASSVSVQSSSSGSVTQFGLKPTKFHQLPSTTSVTSTPKPLPPPPPSIASSISMPQASNDSIVSTLDRKKLQTNRLLTLKSTAWPELRVSPATPNAEQPQRMTVISNASSGGGGGGDTLHVLQKPQLPQTLQLPMTPDVYDANSMRSRSPSPSPSISIRVTTDEVPTFPDDLKCTICTEPFRDPRTLHCLHSFCFQCLLDDNFKSDSNLWSQQVDHIIEETNNVKNNSNYSLRSSTPEISVPTSSSIANNELATVSPARQRGSSFSLRRKKSMDKILLKAKTDCKSSTCSSTTQLTSLVHEKLRNIECRTCKYLTELPLGGICQLPQNVLILRKIEEILLKAGDEMISRVWCTLCSEDTNATYHCVSCTLNLCTLCKESHERQRVTTNHRIKNIMELRQARKQKQHVQDDHLKLIPKCGLHGGFDMKSFCVTCLQLACTDCLVLLHKGHKYETIPKAIHYHAKMLRDSAEQTRPLCNYAEHSIERLNEIARSINRKCDAIQSEVERFMQNYYKALEVHGRTLMQQTQRARESKVEMILEQQLDLEKRTHEAMAAVRFSQELTEHGSDAEILSFVGILIKRFEYCQKFKTPVDPKISDSLHFLPKIRAPSTKEQNDIPLFGIITMQTVEPSLCTLQWEGFSQLRLHKKVDLLLFSRDADGVSLCHGGLQLQCVIKYKESNTRFLPVDVSDHRDGTYSVSFSPDAQGTIILTITINDKPIKGSPFTFLARQVRPHNGIFHCCAFCSSKGNKIVKCSCEGRMPGYSGCGHGHAGHPGRRHWSCCGNVLENSECNVANKLLNT